MSPCEFSAHHSRISLGRSCNCCVCRCAKVTCILCIHLKCEAHLARAEDQLPAGPLHLGGFDDECSVLSEVLPFGNVMINFTSVTHDDSMLALTRGAGAGSVQMLPLCHGQEDV
eukprot:4311040-Amphidinium_carterae.1